MITFSFMTIKSWSGSSGRAVSSRGFTLVELLIVLAIISILLSVLIPAAWSALRTSRQSAATQSSHGIAQLMTQYALDQGQYPDATTSTDAMKLLITKGYLTSADIFYLPNGGQTKFTGTAPGTNLTSVNVSWDITGMNGPSGPVGISVNSPDELPLVYSTGGTVTYPAQAGPGTATCSVSGPLGTAGLAVTYKDNHSAFMKSDLTTGTPTIVNFIAGSFDPQGQTYAQRKP
jgi:prepilin-type N-terminal cleavage/methylation domain-containing protein